MEPLKIFKLFSPCIPVKGARRSGIYDLQRNKFIAIPNNLYSILIEYNNKTLNEILDKFNTKYSSSIVGFFDWLITEELGFWCDEEDTVNFPLMNLEWDSPNALTNCIIDIGDIDSIDYIDLIDQIVDLRIPYLQLRSYHKIDLEFYRIILGNIKNSAIKGIEIITAFSKSMSKENVKNLLSNEFRINQLVLHNSPFDKTDKYFDDLSIVTYTTKIIDNKDCCGIISPNYFSINIGSFTESVNFNSCLNRKISVDIDGEIKNCPSMENSYGNVSSVRLETVLNILEFKELWFIKKDKIEVCKDCEMRYMCTDCRVYTDDSKSDYSRPKKCNYNPYIAKWQGEAGYIPVRDMSDDEITKIKAIHS